MESYTDAIRGFEQFGIEIATKPVRKFWVTGDKYLKASVKVKAQKIGRHDASGGIELAHKSVKLEVKPGGVSNTMNNCDLLESVVQEFTPKVYDAFFSRLFAPDDKDGIKIGTEYPDADDRKQLYEHIRTSMEGFADALAKKFEESAGVDVPRRKEWFSKERVSKIYTQVIDLLYPKITQERETQFYSKLPAKQNYAYEPPVFDMHSAE